MPESVLLPATTAFENSEVLPAPLFAVAVAVITSPAATPAPTRVKLVAVARPDESVFTVNAPR